MTSRERVLSAIAHKEPDRVPVDMGATPSSGISTIAYSNLLKHLGRTDQKTRRIRGACIGAALFVAMMAFVMAIMGWAVYTDPQDAPPLPLLVVMFGIPAGCIVGTLKVLIDRIEEIGKGEEDAYRNY